MLNSGVRAPEFSLAASGGKTVSLADYRGQKAVVVYFYPKDDTMGCTIESCSFRDAYEDFVSLGAEVIGISSDSVASHERFGEKHHLPFILASDPGGTVAKAFGVEKGFLGLPGRITFVIDKQGVIRDSFSSQVRVKTHVARALDLVRDLQAIAP